MIQKGDFAEAGVRVQRLLAGVAFKKCNTVTLGNLVENYSLFHVGDHVLAYKGNIGIQCCLFFVEKKQCYRKHG